MKAPPVAASVVKRLCSQEHGFQFQNAAAQLYLIVRGDVQSIIIDQGPTEGDYEFTEDASLAVVANLE